MYPTKVPLTSLSMVDTDLLEACVWRSVRFFAKMSPSTSMVDGHIIYNCMYFYQKGNDVIVTYKPFRYSEFQAIYDHLVSAYNLQKVFPPYPPKHWWGNTSQSVITTRIRAFDAIFRRMNTVMGVNNDQLLCQFFNLDLSDRKNTDSGNVNIMNTNKFIISEHSD